MKVPNVGNELSRLAASLAVLPGIGANIHRLLREVRLMREAVQELPPLVHELNESVDRLRGDFERLHAQMDTMTGRVEELYGLHAEIAGLRQDLNRLPFMGRGRGKPREAA